MNPNPTAVIALFHFAGTFLGIARKTDHADFGFPGGTIEPGESPEQALIREASEEVGAYILRARAVFQAVSMPGGPDICRAYIVESYIGMPYSKEGTPVAWLTPDQFLAERSTFRWYNGQLFQALERLGRAPAPGALSGLPPF